MRSVLFLLLLFMTIVLGTPVSDEDNPTSCESYLWDYETCAGTINGHSGCETSVLNLRNTNTSELCDSVHFFWSYPIDNLLMIIETPFTKNNKTLLFSLIIIV